MIATRRQQTSFADGFISEMVGDLWEPWMRHADQALEDEALLLIIQPTLVKRCKKSRTRGRPGTTAEVVLRMMLLKHFRDWSFEDLTREVRANLVYREFTRIGGGSVIRVIADASPLFIFAAGRAAMAGPSAKTFPGFEWIKRSGRCWWKW